MEVKSIVLWSIINGKRHRLLEDKYVTPQALEPLVKEIFPGILYFTPTGLGDVIHECVKPVLRKEFEELVGTNGEELSLADKKQIKFTLPCNGNEWSKSKKMWQSKLHQKLELKTA